MRRLTLAVLLPVVLTFSLAACGGGDKTETAGTKAKASASSTPTESDKVADTPAPADVPDGKDLCAYLKSLEPHLKEVGPIGASAQMAMGLAGWVAEHPDQQLRDSMQMDEVMKKSCPDVYKAVLKDLNTKTFQEALG